MQLMVQGDRVRPTNRMGNCMQRDALDWPSQCSVSASAFKLPMHFSANCASAWVSMLAQVQWKWHTKRSKSFELSSKRNASKYTPNDCNPTAAQGKHQSSHSRNCLLLADLPAARHNRNCQFSFAWCLPSLRYNRLDRLLELVRSISVRYCSVSAKSNSLSLSHLTWDK